MRTVLLVCLTALLLGIPGAAAHPLVPPDPSEPQNARSAEDMAKAARNEVKALFPESAPFAPNCISHHVESQTANLYRPVDADHKVTDETVSFYVLVYDTLMRVIVERTCLGAAGQS